MECWLEFVKLLKHLLLIVLLTGNHLLQLIDHYFGFYFFSSIWTTISNTNHQKPAIQQHKITTYFCKETFFLQQMTLFLATKWESVKCNFRLRFPAFFLYNFSKSLKIIKTFFKIFGTKNFIKVFDSGDLGRDETSKDFLHFLEELDEFLDLTALTLSLKKLLSRVVLKGCLGLLFLEMCLRAPTKVTN